MVFEVAIILSRKEKLKNDHNTTEITINPFVEKL